MSLLQSLGSSVSDAELKAAVAGVLLGGISMLVSYAVWNNGEEYLGSGSITKKDGIEQFVTSTLTQFNVDTDWLMATFPDPSVIGL